jgi:hypothetical protein
MPLKLTGEVTFSMKKIAGLKSEMLISGKEMPGYFDLEYAACGEGETVMSEFVNRIENLQAPDGFKELIIGREKTVIQDNGPSRVQDPDKS